MKKKSSYLLNGLGNFNEIFRKDVAYNNITIQKSKASFSLKNTLLKKPGRACQIDPRPFV